MHRAEKDRVQARIDELHDAAPMGFLTLSAQGLILTANHTAAELLADGSDTLVGKPFSAFIPSDNLECENLIANTSLEPTVHQLCLARADGSKFWVHLAVSTCQCDDTEPIRQVALIDITTYKQTEQALRESQEGYRLLFEAASDALLLVATDTFQIIKANSGATELYGTGKDALTGRRITDLADDPHETLRVLQEARAGHDSLVQFPLLVHRKQDGTVFPVEITGRFKSMHGRLVLLLAVRDITRRKRAEAVMAARLRVLRAAHERPLTEVLQITLDEIEQLTGSLIGFYHFVEESQAVLTLQAWSTNTRERMCRAEGFDLHYPISHAGVWADCYHARRPVVHNDYASLPHRKGMPAGHAPVIRELVVPVLRGDTIVALLGVGNKPAEYTDQDVETVAVLADLAWDIVERKRAEESLRRSEEEQRRIQEQSNAQLTEQAESLASIYRALDSVGVIVTNLEENDAQIAVFNTGAEKLFGWRQEEAVGQPITLIYPTEMYPLKQERVRKLRSGESMQSFDMTLVRRSGERFPAVISVHPFDCRDGRYRKAVGIFRDISELKRVQLELEAINEDLERRVEARTKELQETQKQYLHAEKLSAIGKLSASIAHEFNNPLQGILAIIKGVKKRAVLEPEDRDLLEAAIGECDRIKELIRSLQDFNRPSSGRRTMIDIHKSLESILLLHKNDFKTKRIRVECDFAAHLPQILAVPDQIKQVLLNLLTNAADACHHPGCTITVRTRGDGETITVAISDTGIGIKPEEIELIFQPFYTTKPEVKGTGLGLSVSYGIVKKHGGSIEVESQPGVGSTFTIRLPIRGNDDSGE